MPRLLQQTLWILIPLLSSVLLNSILFFFLKIHFLVMFYECSIRPKSKCNLPSQRGNMQNCDMTNQLGGQLTWKCIINIFQTHYKRHSYIQIKSVIHIHCNTNVVWLCVGKAVYYTVAFSIQPLELLCYCVVKHIASCLIKIIMWLFYNAVVIRVGQKWFCQGTHSNIYTVELKLLVAHSVQW